VDGKAAKWVEGRKDWERRLAAALPQTGRRIWVHCSSLGEFEQGRPIMEALKAQYPDCAIILTFFSPSGYEARKDYALASTVCYLPHDGAATARRFLDMVQPELVIFVKYEFWYFYLRELKARGIPSYLVSAAFRPSQAFFKGYGGFFREMLGGFSALFVQDAESAALLGGIGLGSRVVVAGDTRYDRVAAIAAAAKELPLIARYKGSSPILIAGSTWPGDEQALQGCMGALPAGWKLILAPHEVDVAHVASVRQLFGAAALLYSDLVGGASSDEKTVLIIDNIGMLSSLYAYGDVAWVGGGFQKGGIHNTLEPAVFGLPVVMGPVYAKFVEARELVAHGYAYPVAGKDEARAVLAKLCADAVHRTQLKTGIQQFMAARTGATRRIMAYVAGILGK